MATQIHEIEQMVIGAGVLYGYPAVRAAEKAGRLEINGRYRRFWEDLRELATEEIQPGKLQIELVKRGHDIKDLLYFQEKACSLEFLEGYADILRQEAAKRAAIKEKRRELEELVNGKVIPLPTRGSEVKTALEILNTEFPEPVWVLPEVIPAGLTILAGKPKLGKSWFALNLALSIANGGRALGRIKVDEAQVLYLALEDTPRRIQNRLKQLSGYSVEKLNNLHFAFEWPRGIDGATKLNEYLSENPEIKFVIIDTLQKIVDPQTKSRDAYASDYENISLLKRVADERDVAILVIHHTRKGESEDPFEDISGTTGKTGGADTSIVLRRGRGESDATLHITGRDVIEQEIALRWDDLTGWVLLGYAEEYTRTREQRQIIDILEEAEEPMSPKEIAEISGKKPGATKTMLFRMEKEGIVRKVTRGKYILCNHCNLVTFETKTQVEPGKQKLQAENGSVTFKDSAPKGYKVTEVTNKHVTFNSGNKLGKDEKVTKLHEESNLESNLVI